MQSASLKALVKWYPPPPHGGIGLACRLLVLVLLCVAALDVQAGELEVRDRRIVWTPGRIPSRAYFELINHGAESVALTGARSPDYARIEFKAAPDSDLFILEALDMPQVIGPGDRLSFHRNGPYLILHLGDEMITPGTVTTLVLEFSHHAPLPVRFTVRK